MASSSLPISFPPQPKMLLNSNLISCNSPTSRSLIPRPLISRISSQFCLNSQEQSFAKCLNPRNFHKSWKPSVSEPFSVSRRWAFVKFGCNSFKSENSEDPELEKGSSSMGSEVSSGNGGNGGEDWTTSILLFVFYAGVMYYVFMLTPNQTPSRDMYFLEKLLNLKGNDGFKMNEVLVSLWYIMGLWPLVYSMLLLPSGRSSRSKVPVWPFLVFSCFGGAYALFPYFVLWKPPPPPVEEAELGRWPLNFMESKITAGILFAAGLGLITYAGLASGDVWTEFYQYFRESKFIHATCLDFTLLSVFAPFWVYNDMTSRKWSDKGWILPLALIPFLGPTLYLILRPPVSALPVSRTSTTTKQN